MSNGHAHPVLSVSELTAILKETLETAFPAVWISGEITNLSSPRSGHIYFTLRDESAQIRAVIWRSTASRLKFELTDGMEVVCGGGLDLYPPRGSYQLVVRNVEPRGLGAQQLALRRLQERLAAEGLFDRERKRTLPKFPRRVGFVTSPTGAAIRDFCEVANRRWRGTEICVIPTRVQGEGAGAEIASAIEQANRLQPPLDVLVVGRGGGSAEDLWCFNDEAVVRAIFASRIPVVSAVGHEIDVTLSDLVADLRALTPTEAAELVLPSREDLAGWLKQQQQRLTSSLRSRAAAARSQLESVAGRRVFRRPLDGVRDLERRLDELDARLARGVQIQHRELRRGLTSVAERLETLSPLAVLGRGYGVTELETSGEVVTSVEQLAEDQRIVTRLADGRVVSRVEGIQLDEVRPARSADPEK